MAMFETIREKGKSLSEVAKSTSKAAQSLKGLKSNDLSLLDKVGSLNQAISDSSESLNKLGQTFQDKSGAFVGEPAGRPAYRDISDNLSKTTDSLKEIKQSVASISANLSGHVSIHDVANATKTASGQWDKSIAKIDELITRKKDSEFIGTWVKNQIGEELFDAVGSLKKGCVIGVDGVSDMFKAVNTFGGSYRDPQTAVQKIKSGVHTVAASTEKIANCVKHLANAIHVDAQNNWLLDSLGSLTVNRGIRSVDVTGNIASQGIAGTQKVNQALADLKKGDWTQAAHALKGAYADFKSLPKELHNLQTIWTKKTEEEKALNPSHPPQNPPKTPSGITGGAAPVDTSAQETDPLPDKGKSHPDNRNASSGKENFSATAPGASSADKASSPAQSQTKDASSSGAGQSNLYYVCTGATLRCTQGTSLGRLTATPKMVSLCANDQANITDFIPLVNIPGFGLCRSLAYPPTASATAANFGQLTPMPCVPGTCAPWSTVDANSLLAGSPALLDKAKLSCMYNGTISIVNAGQSLEKTGAKPIDIQTKPANVERYFWADTQGNECDLHTLDGSSYYALCLQTSLKEGDQLTVEIGHSCYHAIVGAGGVAKVENVDIAEIDWNLPITAKGAAAPVPPAAPPAPAQTSHTNTTNERNSPDKKATFDQLAAPTAGSIPYSPYQVNEKVRKAQLYLNEYNGHKALACDGRLGRKTREALLAFQKKAGLNATGNLDSATQARLEAEHKKRQEKQKNDNRNAHPKGSPHTPATAHVATVPSKQTESWGDPVANPKIRRNQASNLYGPVRRNANGSPRNHQGFDYYAPAGTPVRSVADGVVYRIETRHFDYGNNVTIKHPRGKTHVYSFYAHLSKIAPALKAGKIVKKGEVIGYAGTTGNAQGMRGPDEHLHFEARTSPGHQIGLGGKECPNNIVSTKFYSANPGHKNQASVTVVKK